MIACLDKNAVLRSSYWWRLRSRQNLPHIQFTWMCNFFLLFQWITGSFFQLGHSPAVLFGLKSIGLLGYIVKDCQCFLLLLFNFSFMKLMESLKPTLTCWWLCSGQRHNLRLNGQQNSSGAHLLCDSLVARPLADKVTDLISKCSWAWKSVEVLLHDYRCWDSNLTTVNSNCTKLAQAENKAYPSEDIKLAKAMPACVGKLNVKTNWPARSPHSSAWGCCKHGAKIRGNKCLWFDLLARR